jgi:hypothetical protein
MRCSNCICPEAVRSRYRWYELWRLGVLLRPFRCAHCNTRYWRFLWQQVHEAHDYFGRALLRPTPSSSNQP